MRPIAALFALFVFPIEPQPRMCPEKRERTAKQPEHEFRSDPRIGITSEVVAIGVRLECNEPGSRILVTCLASLQTMVRMYR